MSLSKPIEGGPATLPRIFGAICYDTFILIAIYMVIILGFVALNEGEAVISGSQLYSLQQSVLFLITFGYLADSWVRRGQTIGMLAWKIKLLSRTGKPITIWQALLRFCSAFLGIGNIWILFDAQMRSWHDIFSETQLVRMYIDNE
ncbi:MAG: RDD family protein [Methylococcales bacterium]|mgnify:CR=1 FL=1|jgi:uncharacterized RDD family membrane protein YckC|nr:RDD family protein [Methylococcales bacterium]MBT7443010.1 RDD family protein [Methylococcales bacterium]